MKVKDRRALMDDPVLVRLLQEVKTWEARLLLQVGMRTLWFGAKVSVSAEGPRRTRREVHEVSLQYLEMALQAVSELVS